MKSAEEKSLKKFFGSRLFFVFLFITALMVSFAYARSYYQDYLVRQEILRLQEEARTLEAKKIKLLDILKYVKSDAFVEAKARSELNMIKPGEQVTILPLAPENASGQGKNIMVGFNESSNLKKWWDYFFKE